MIKQILITISISLMSGYLGAWLYDVLFRRTDISTKILLEHIQKMQKLHNEQWQVTLSSELLNETKTQKE